MGTVFILLIILIPLIAFILISTKNNKYKKINIKKDINGYEVARSIMDIYDLNNVYIVESKESLINNYDPERKVVRLKKNIFNTSSLTSCAISAKVGAYAIQDKTKHKLYTFRKNIDQFLQILLYIGYLVIAFGSLFGHFKTIYVGVGLEYVVLLFHLFTIKIEMDASNIAIKGLEKEKIVNKKELEKIKDILKTNNYIYLACIIYPIIELFKRIIAFGDSSE